MKTTPPEQDLTHEELLNLLVVIKAQRQDTVPLIDKTNTLLVAQALNQGQFSARRAARELDASFDDINATFAHHNVDFEIQL